jgi:hypothetical protein
LGIFWLFTKLWGQWQLVLESNRIERSREVCSCQSYESHRRGAE